MPSSDVFRELMIHHFWKYIESHPILSVYLDRTDPTTHRPPVFQERYAHKNLLRHPRVGLLQRNHFRAIIPKSSRHRWFRSMSSSQALTQTVFGNLICLNEIDVLEKVLDDGGLPILGSWRGRSRDVQLEYSVHWLGEPRPTSLDVYFPGKYSVAVECKLTEQDIGRCSRPDLDYNHQEYCDGTYTFQRGRESRCPLTERGVKYWEHVPHLFSWQDEYHDACPLHKNYQLVRNVLAAAVRPSGEIHQTGGHALLLYDDRNPSFVPGGDALAAFDSTRAGLIDKDQIRKCSWQSLLAQLQSRTKLAWLIEGLGEKYGFGR